MAQGKPKAASLDDLRARIDAVDDGLHDLLMERARIVEEVARLKRSDSLPPFRPGREAQIVRRLVARHRGSFPRGAVVRIWREILGGSIAMQARLAVAMTTECAALARDHFGGKSPMIDLHSPAEVILSVREGRASVGIVPVPVETAEPWWLDLATIGEGRPRIIARLPFGACAESEPCQDAFVLAAMEPEPSGDDCSVLAITLRAPLPAARLTDAFLAARLDCTPLARVEGDGGATALVVVEAFLAASDARVAKTLLPLGAGVAATWLGAYARPLPDAALERDLPE